MKNDYKPWKNYGYDKHKHAEFSHGEEKAREKYLLAKANNPKQTPDEIKTQQHYMKQHLESSREHLKKMGESDNYPGTVDSWNMEHRMRELRLHGERTERNRKKAFSKIQSGDYYKPTKCSKCNVTFPNQSAYQHHIDNDQNWAKGSKHHG